MENTAHLQIHEIIYFRYYGWDFGGGLSQIKQ